MSFEFYLGLFCGAAVMYIIREVSYAFEKPNDVQARLNQCTLEAVRSTAERNLARYSNEELVAAVAKGIMLLPPRD